MNKKTDTETIQETLSAAQRQSFLGQYFHTFAPNGPVKYQGRIIADAGQGYFLCELYSWVDGDSGNSQIFHIDKMKDWSFYPTSEQMNYQYETRLRHIKAKN